MSRRFLFPVLFLSSFSFLHAAPLVAQPTAESAPIRHLTVWELMASTGWVIFPIALLSFIIVGLIAFNFFWLHERNVASANFLDKAHQYLKKKHLEGLLDLCDQTNQVAARVVSKVVTFARDNPTLDMEALKHVADAEGARQAALMNQPTQLLMDMGVMAPMVGLLGTVVGILRSFGSIASDATPMRTLLLAGGVSQALVATAMGLSIGLVAMFFYAYFRARVLTLVTYLESSLAELLVKTYHRLGEAKEHSK